MTLNEIEFQVIKNLCCEHILTEEQTFVMKTIFYSDPCTVVFMALLLLVYNLHLTFTFNI